MFGTSSGLLSGLFKNIVHQEKVILSVMTKTKLTNYIVVRGSSKYTLTPNMTLNTLQPVVMSSKGTSLPKVDLRQTRPMVVLLEYMNAKKKHIQKISDIYLGQGFDVLEVGLSPFQLLFPVKGSQIVAKDLADFLMINNSFSPLLIHGFSVGGYLWGETLTHFKMDLKQYQCVIDRIKGHIFDSLADIEAIPTAFPSSIFPKNSLLKTTFKTYLSFHLKFFYETSTKHYERARKTFTSGLVKAPSFFITSNADILSSPESVLKARDEILAHNLEVQTKVYEGSKHVMHFKTYPSEYIADIHAFLEKIGLQNLPTQLKAKL